MKRLLGSGFTLAELLIALAILGVIATFTIPKVLQSQANTRDKALAKEVAGMVSAAYQAYKQQNVPTAAFSATHLTPYLNYVRRDTVTTIDYMPNGLTPTLDCSAAGNTCMLLHNGGMFHVTTTTFTGTTNLNTVHACVDPDAKVTGAPGDTGKSVCFMLYYDGRLTTRGDALPNSCTTAPYCPFGPDPTLDPAWFSWN